MDYLDAINRHRESAPQHAAAPGGKAAVFYEAGAKPKKPKLRGAKKKAFLKRMAAGRRKAVKAAAKGLTKPTGKTSTGKRHGDSGGAKKAPTEGSSMAKAKRKKARTAKQKAATRRMIAANRAKHRGPAKVTRHKKSTRKKYYKAAPGTPKRKKSKGKRRTQKRAVVVTQRKGRKGPVVVKTNRSVKIVKVPGKTRVIRVAAETRHRKHHRKARERYAMENPLGAGELFVGGLTLMIGFVVADAADRALATHALTAATTATPAANGLVTDTVTGNPLQIDIPPTTGSYPGLLNGAAVEAPIWKSPVRLAVDLGVFVALPFVSAYFVKAPMGRSALQLFGFGAFARVGGKALVDLVAMLTAKTSMGQRLYDVPLRAGMLAAGTAYAGPTLPSSGLGAPAGYGESNDAPPPPPPPPYEQPASVPAGVGAPAAAPLVDPPTAHQVAQKKPVVVPFSTDMLEAARKTRTA